MKYTIIPDIHADFERLNWSISQSKGRQIVLLGDLIDAGKAVKLPNDVGVLTSISKLIEIGQAVCVLGNHELNAILFHRRSSTTGMPLRAHKVQHFNQHKSFIDSFGIETIDALDWTSWMLKTLPLWFELDGVRVVHACWSDNAINIIKKRRPDGYLQVEDLDEIAAKDTEFACAVETITSGPEARLPEGYSFIDNGGHKRKSVRLSWWNSNNTSWKKAALSVPNLDQLPNGKLPENLLDEIYHSDAIPVLVGHYKMKGKPKIQSSNASSLDFPSNSCVYQWAGESELTNKNLVLNI